MRYCRKDRRKKDLRILFFFLNLLRNSLYTLSLCNARNRSRKTILNFPVTRILEQKRTRNTLPSLQEKIGEIRRKEYTHETDRYSNVPEEAFAQQEIVFAKENSRKASRWRGRKNCRGKTFRMIPFSRLNLLRDAGHCGCAQWS